jgi:general secretion pathway protein H
MGRTPVRPPRHRGEGRDLREIKAPFPRRDPGSRRDDKSGFTLVELMVVLVIVGLMSAAVVMAMPDPRGALRGEALRFAARADAARERAMMDNKPVALVLKEGGYGFEWRTGGEWRPVGRRPFVAQDWSEGTHASIEGGESRIVFDSTGFAEPARLRLERGKEVARIEVSDGGRVRVLP